MMRRGVIVAAAVLTAGCRSQSGGAFTSAAVLAPSSDAEAAHDELLHADLTRADTVARLGLAAGLISLFTSDVIYLRGGMPLLRGRDAARAVLGADTLATTAGTRWQPVRAEVSRDRLSGYTYGYAVYAHPQRAAASIRIDRYIAFWRKEGGRWRISGYAETYGTPPAVITLPVEAEHGILADVTMSPRQGALDVIRQADIQFSSEATRSGTGEAFRRFAAPDAQVFSASGEFISGPDAIAQSFGPSSSRSTLVWHPVEGEMSASGDLGFTVGNAVFTDEREGAPPVVRHSKYLTVWKKQRDGTWRYVVDGGSPRPRT